MTKLGASSAARTRPFALRPRAARGPLLVLVAQDEVPVPLLVDEDEGLRHRAARPGALALLACEAPPSNAGKAADTNAAPGEGAEVATATARRTTPTAR